MVDMFVKKMCYYCCKDNCSKKVKSKVKVIKLDNCTTYKCDEYVKDESKIVPYVEPLIVTAERDYVSRIEK